MNLVYQNESGRWLYIVIYDPLTGKHRPLTPKEEAVLEEAVLKKREMKRQRWDLGP